MQVHHDGTVGNREAICARTRRVHQREHNMMS